MSSYLSESARSAPSWDTLDAGYDDDEIDLSEYQYAARDHILFAIDASESMQTPLPDQENDAGRIRGKSPLHQALEAVVKIERTKVITGPADSVGILLFNVDKNPKDSQASQTQSKSGTFVVQAVRMISAEEIKRLIKLLEAANDQYQEQEDSDEPTVEPEIIRETYPPLDKKSELNIADVLSTCNHLFRDGGTKLTGNKRVFLVTNNDQPPGSATNRAPARTTFGDLATYGVTVNTFFIDRPDHVFDPRLYWNDILDRPDEEGEPQPQEGLEELSELMLDLVIRQAPKRRQFSIPLKFGGREGDIEIGVAGYALISVQTKGQPKLVRMRGQTVEEVEAKTQYTSAETGGELKDQEITSAFQFGNESTVQNVLEPNWWETDEHQEEQRQYAEELLRIDRAQRGMDVEDEEQVEGDSGDKSKLVARTRLQFTEDQIRSFKTMDIEPPQIKILGFQSPEHLRPEDNIKHSYFIYPDETVYQGSTRTFSALLQSCIKLDRHVLALCRFRNNSQPEFCILIPQKETFSKDGGQEDPPGFHVIILPFRDDLRDPPKTMDHNITATDDQVKVMERMMKRLKFKNRKYASDAWPNPALQYHYQQLQALAFEEDFDTDAFDDKALPKYAGIHRAAGSLMLEWKKLIDDDERASVILAPTKAKRSVIEVDASDLVDVSAAYEDGTMDKLKVADLRNYAKYHSISLSGKTKKADIIDALQDHLAAASKKKKSKK